VTDGTATTTGSFLLTVNAVNDAPTITDIANQVTNEDTLLNSVSFSISDVDSTVDCSSVTKNSTNT
jgi:hypothetical protein